MGDKRKESRSKVAEDSPPARLVVGPIMPLHKDDEVPTETSPEAPLPRKYPKGTRVSLNSYGGGSLELGIDDCREDNHEQDGGGDEA